ncbi:MAG TPA: tRNA (adenosine(37)-N6)-threonylcarbamoyltransferase complex ATPase subunit type 1 TsaE [Devosiaceae bacterium]|jgi:tRNA threonylcarbamoyl adenosine modification protein YjeE
MAGDLFLPDDAATAQLGVTLGQVLKPGDVVLLEGDLGAGKTALARSIIRTLMGDERLDVPSPSFSLVQPYEGNARFVLHADLYRLAAESEVDELGLLDRPDAIVLVEWPERAPGLVAEASVMVRLRIAAGGEGRLAGVTFRDGRTLAP